jgi:AraC-like DNA-binding protein
MTFLTGWRSALAAELLRELGATIGSVAAWVGCGSRFALGTAFKRVRGVSPRAAVRRGCPLGVLWPITWRGQRVRCLAANSRALTR